MKRRIAVLINTPPRLWCGKGKGKSYVGPCCSGYETVSSKERKQGKLWYIHPASVDNFYFLSVSDSVCLSVRPSVGFPFGHRIFENACFLRNSN